jgi:hypothetical protein
MTAEEKERPEVTALRQVAGGMPRLALLTAAASAQMLVAGWELSARPRAYLSRERLAAGSDRLLYKHQMSRVTVCGPGRRNVREPAWASLA